MLNPLQLTQHADSRRRHTPIATARITGSSPVLPRFDWSGTPHNSIRMPRRHLLIENRRRESLTSGCELL